VNLRPHLFLPFPVDPFLECEVQLFSPPPKNLKGLPWPNPQGHWEGFFFMSSFFVAKRFMHSHNKALERPWVTVGDSWMGRPGRTVGISNFDAFPYLFLPE